MDATRVSDKALVYIKRVATDSNELKIALLLSSEKHLKDSRNHSVPILDHFEDELESGMSFMVMPYLLSIDERPFELVDNVVDFVDQVLEVC